jgi:YHS domain-containing protein
MKRKSTDRLVTDPVCQMEFTADKAAATLKYNRRTYYFCHVACLRVFEADPLAYADDAQDNGKQMAASRSG